MKKILASFIFIGVWLVHAPLALVFKKPRCPLCRWAEKNTACRCDGDVSVAEASTEAAE